ncbi:MAG: FecR domain-containing protein [Treponema sp.]|nr:FecR domain-containing protein [Treponema sp.]
MRKRFGTALAVLLVMALAVGAVSAEDASVVSVTGKVEMQHGATWVPVQAGARIQKGAVLSTGFRSGAVLRIGDSTLTVGPLTRMTVEQLISSQHVDEAQVFLDSGRVSADVKRTADRLVSFKVTSPVATASVRGTSFSMTAAGRLRTTEGLVGKSPAESSRAVIAADTPSGFVPSEGTSAATTPTDRVGAAGGIPVFAGQSSRTDTITGIAAAPQTEKAFESARLANTTAPLALRERVTTTATGITVEQAAIPLDYAAVTASSGTAVTVVEITFPQKQGGNGTSNGTTGG